MTTRWLWLLLGLLLASRAASAGEQAQAGLSKDGLRSRLMAVSAPLAVQGDHFSGPGWDLVAQGVAKARFVAIGEDHVTQEVPAFVGAICDAIGPGKLAAMAVEAGPRAAQFVGLNLHASDHEQKMAALVARFPDAVAFLDIAQENRLASHCASVSGTPGFEIWGLDQEFLGSGGWLLDMILHETLSPAARSAILALRAEEQGDAAKAKASGDPTKLFVFAVSDQTLVEAAAQLRSGGNAESRLLLQSIATTHRIYTENAAEPARSNQDRALLLKHNFLDDIAGLDASHSGGRILLKFGDWHLYRGFNPLGERDLGNFLAEYGDLHATPSFHIAVLGSHGLHAAYAGYGRPMSITPFTMADDPDYHWLKPAADVAGPAGWTVFDLRRLRGRSLADLPADWQRMAEGYDLLVLAPVITPAALVH